MRPVEPEAVFGDIKYDHGFKRFRLKGMAKVNVEFGLVALAHNLRKYARVQTLEWPPDTPPYKKEVNSLLSQPLFRGTWQIRTADLMRVKHAL